MGWLIYEIEVEGRANHCGAKWDGVNAIEKMAKIIAGLQEAERNWALTRRHPYLPPQSISIDTIRGGTASTIVPDLCKLEVIVHFQPHHEPGYRWMGEKYDQEVREVIRRVALSDPWMEAHPPKVTLYQLGSSCDIGVDHPICRALSEKTVEITGKKPGCQGPGQRRGRAPAEQLRRHPHRAFRAGVDGDRAHGGRVCAGAGISGLHQNFCGDDDGLVRNFLRW